MKKIDFIVVGQGLAGSVLAYHLLKKGQKVVVIDNYREGGKKSSSQIAAGVINPITGMRFVKTWRIDEFMASARAFYLEMETVLGVKLWHERSIIRAIRTVEEENNWLLRSNYPDYQPFCETRAPSRLFRDVPSVKIAKIKHFYALAAIKNAAQVNLPLFVEQSRLFFKNKEMLLTEDFDKTALHISTEKVTYKDITASKIIFCEGIQGKNNPLFKHLPFNPDKGELLLVRIPNLDLTQIFKNKMAIVPLHDTDGISRNPEYSGEGGLTDLYWVGATNTWAFDDDLPSEAAKSLIINELKEMLSIPFEVMGHQAAIRPTVKDRRPFIGCLSEQSNVGIFNGFGTKGASLAPFWASHFTDVLLNGTPLDKAVDIRRFGE